MNRPYGAVDVAANLKGAVPKAATQKILLALAEKGELVQKIYGLSLSGIASNGAWSKFSGKTTFFVANQAKIDALSPDQIHTSEEELKLLDEENKAFAAQIKTATTGRSYLTSIPLFCNNNHRPELAKIKNTPSDSELDEQLASAKDLVRVTRPVKLTFEWTIYFGLYF